LSASATTVDEELAMDAYILPDDRWYTASHLWVDNQDGFAVIGLTERGQELYGKVLYVGLPAVGAPVQFGMPLGYLQSAGFGLTQLFPPVQGEVAAINDDLWTRPTLVNEDPLGDGWIYAVQMTAADELDELESAAEYRQILAGERFGRGAELPQDVRQGARPAFLIDERRRVLDCNAAAEQLIALSRRELQHNPLCAEVFGCEMEGGAHVTKHDCPGLCAMLNLEPVHGAEYSVTNARGGSTRVRADYTPVALPGQPRRAVVVLELAD